MKIEDVIEKVREYLKEKYNELFISCKEKFIGCKLSKDSKYYILFISNYENYMTLSYRENINCSEIKRMNIENLELEEIFFKMNIIINNVLKNESSIMKVNNPDQMIETETNMVEEVNSLISEITILEKKINYNEIKDKYGKLAIENLKFNSIRLYNICKNYNINTLFDILITPIKKFATFSWCGRKTLQEIAEIKKFYINGDNSSEPITSFNGSKNIIPRLEERFYDYEQYLIQLEFDEKSYDQYLDFGIEIGLVTVEIMKKIITERDLEIFQMRMNIIDCEKNTLAYIGHQFHLTRERIRQILEKIFRKVKHPKYSKILKKEYISRFNKIKTEELLNYLLIGILNVYNQNFLEFILNSIDRKFSEKIMNKILNYYYEEKKKNEMIIKEDKILSLIKFPDKLTDNGITFFSSLNQVRKSFEENNYGYVHIEGLENDIEYESFLEKNVIQKLSECSFVKNIKSQSLIIPYEYKGKKMNYYPDIQILFNDERVAIIEVKPLAFMADSLNIVKYEALKQFCEYNGFGYGMLDDRNHCFEDLLKIEIPHNIEEQFLNYLKEKGKMNYYEFKNMNNVSFSQLEKIVLNNINNIEYRNNPFYLKYIPDNDYNSVSNPLKVKENSINKEILLIDKLFFRSIIPQNDQKIAGVFRIRFLNEVKVIIYYYNIKNISNNITQDQPIFNYLLYTEEKMVCEKFNFIMLEKILIIPEDN